MNKSKFTWLLSLSVVAAVAVGAWRHFEQAYADTPPAAPTQAVANAENAAPAGKVRVQSIGMTVSDINKVLPFYTDTLTFKVVNDVIVDDEQAQRMLGVEGAKVRVVTLQLGKEQIELVDYLTPEGDPFPADTKSNDHWFQHIAIIVSDLDKAHDVITKAGGKPASRGPQVLPDWNPNAGGIGAYYFRDPDGRFLEILQFPKGKGEERWQEKDRLFLGIDHTAIVVSDTDASLKMYRDVLGMRVLGASENHGVEQEKLNNVFGARLRITAIKGESGMVIEFLEYLSPSTGRETPPDLMPNDLAHWHIRIGVDNLDGLEKASRKAELHWMSPGVVKLGDDKLGFKRGLLARDRDLHSLLFTGQ